MYTDQPGRFPATSSSGNQYIMVLVEVDGNYIDAEPMKNMTSGSMIKAYIALWTCLTATGVIQPTTHLLDNEPSAKLKAEIRKNCMIQIVPPDNHRRNLAERAMQMFKNHFKAILAGVDESFQMQLWDKLLPQTVLTLNLLQQSNVAPTVSAYQYVQGHLDYSRMLLAPMGCAFQLYKSTTRRGTWAKHSTDGWYLGSSNKHYQCHKIYVKKTRSKHISDKVFFKHRYITQPTLTPTDTIVKALDDLTHALKGRKNVEGDAQIEALEKICSTTSQGQCHPQPPPIQTDNTTAEGVINNKIQPKQTKAMDMRFHWLCNPKAQDQLRIHWRPGKTNLAGYFTKHHPPAHHVSIRSQFLTRVKEIAEAQCQNRTEQNNLEN